MTTTFPSFAAQWSVDGTVWHTCGGSEGCMCVYGDLKSTSLVSVSDVAEWINLEMSETGMRPGTSAVVAGLFLDKFGGKS